MQNTNKLTYYHYAVLALSVLYAIYAATFIVIPAISADALLSWSVALSTLLALGLIAVSVKLALDGTQELEELKRESAILETLGSRVMFADTDLNIRYMNRSVKEIMHEVESDLKKDLPNFDASTLMGYNIDNFHKNPAKQRGMLAKLNDTYHTSITVGGRIFELMANPVFAKDGERLGSVVEWNEVTAKRLELNEINGKLEAIDRAQAVIEFKADGTILNANENFLKTMGYSLEEIQGKHHSMFVEDSYRNSAEYSQFWEALRRGEFQTAEYKRIGKGGKEIWIQAVYSPIFDNDGNTIRVIKYATNITEQKIKNADYEGQIEAIGKSQAVIQFDLDGTILKANQNFLDALGYTLEEIKGKHHSMFAEPAYAASPEYKAFWERLRRGEFDSGEYKRLAKGGKEIWIQASYNPITDAEGKPVKVVKYATDVTAMVTTRTENERGMNEAVEVLTELSKGNLTVNMNGDYKGTFSEIKVALNATIEKLVDIVQRIKMAAESVNSASSEISSGSSDLAQRTQEQASSLEETAASMEEITSTVRLNSDNATNANDMATKASDVAENGGQVVRQAVDAMGSIEQSSQKISEIIGVIDEIAFQTNLLALNAAVEAARAGEAGKGFAVVASEVRSLAGRSASASKEIKALISESGAQVKTGAELVNQAGSTLEEIVSSVRNVASLISEIATASAEQASGIDEVNAAITQMDEVTQQNAALVEENEAAASSLVDQATDLDSMVSFFRVNEDEEGDMSAMQPHYGGNGIVSPANGNGVAPRMPAGAMKLTQSKSANGTAGGASIAPDDDWEEF